MLTGVIDMNGISKTSLYGFLLSISLLGCNDKDSKDEQSSLYKYQGEWAEVGTGLTVDIQKESAIAYRYTRETCSIISRFDTLADAESALTHITSGSNSNNFSFIPAGHSEFYRIDLISQNIPEACRNAPDPQAFDPEFIFNHTWNALNDYYPFFELRGVDWVKQREIFRPMVNPATSQQELFSIISEMLSPLDDHHVGLLVDTDDLQQHFSPGRNSGWLASALAILRYIQLNGDMANPITPQYFPDGLSTIISNNYGVEAALNTSTVINSEGSPPILRWGKLAGNIGYLQINSMEISSDTDSISVDEQSQSLISEMDAIIGELQDTQGMIIDVRFNSGGFDELAMLIAGYFTEQTSFVFSKENYNHGDPGVRHRYYLEPSQNITYSNPVILITGPDTASAAEVFTLAMRTLPQVTVTGERTHGIHSDVLEFNLMEGWELNLSYQTYYSPDEQVYEYVGIPPDTDVPVASYYASFQFGALPAIHQALSDIGVDLSLSNSEFLQRAQNILDETGIPGLSITWTDNSHILGSTTLGYANLENQTPVTTSTPFGIASVSKTFIGVSFMQLLENSLIDIATSLGDLTIPFSVTNPYFSAEDITFIDLATHTSGIRDGEHYFCGYYLEADHSNLLAHYSDEFAQCPEPVETNQARFLASLLNDKGNLYDGSQFTEYRPGSVYLYSNLGAALSAEMLTAASGTDLETWTEENIFQPLGMTHTHWFKQRFDMDDEMPASRYLLTDGEATALPEYTLATWGDGSVIASSPDLSRYLLAVVQGGLYNGERILQQDSVDYMLSSVFKETTPVGHQGIFWYGDNLMFGHDGSAPGTYAQMQYEKYNKLGMVIMLNLSDDLGENEAFDSQLVQLNNLIYRRGLSLKKE
jgi:CubicO group peptidase (beta-lactamase class C family)